MKQYEKIGMVDLKNLKARMTKLEHFQNAIPEHDLSFTFQLLTTYPHA